MLALNRTKILALVFISALLAAILFFYFLDERFYNDIMTRCISARVIEGARSFEEKVGRLRSFVHENVHPIYGEKNRLDTVGIEKLVSGVGWCDQQARVFMQLAKKAGITTRLLFLRNKEGSSPHTIAEAEDKDRWVLVDAAYDLDFRNKKGEMASMEDVKNDFDIVLENPRVEKFAEHNPWWRNKENLTMYARTPNYIVTREGVHVRILGILPSFLRTPLVSLINEIYIFKNRKNFSNADELLYYRARTYHLIGREKEAENLYKEILRRKGAAPLKDKTRFFFALLLRDQKKAVESLRVLTDLINEYNNKNWLLYAHGLRSRIYESMGNAREAETDFAKVASAPDCYF